VKSALKAAGIFVGVVCAYVWLLLPVPLLIHYQQSERAITYLSRIQAYERERGDYLFEGANKRGLLDLCEDAAGNLKVLWKDECK